MRDVAGHMGDTVLADDRQWQWTSHPTRRRRIGGACRPELRDPVHGIPGLAGGRQGRTSPVDRRPPYCGPPRRRMVESRDRSPAAREVIEDGRTRLGTGRLIRSIGRRLRHDSDGAPYLGCHGWRAAGPGDGPSHSWPAWPGRPPVQSGPGAARTRAPPIEAAVPRPDARHQPSPSAHSAFWRRARMSVTLARPTTTATRWDSFRVL